MRVISRVKQKLFFWKDYYPTQAIVYRNRGSTYSPELSRAVRFKWEDKPNAHQLATGEETSAVPLDYVLTSTDGKPFIHFVEAEDDQLIPFKFKIKTDSEGNAVVETGENGKKQPLVETVLIENKDERLNFWVDHLKHSDEKYTVPGWIANNKELVLPVVTAIAVAIIFYAAGQQFGDAVPYLNQLTEQIPSLTDALQTAGGTSAPPGR